MRHRFFTLACSFILAAAGLSITAGWLLQWRPLLLASPATGYTVFTTGLLLAACGFWFILAVLRPQASRGLRQGLALVLVVLPLLVLVEHLSGLDLNVDMRFVHQWLVTDNPLLGRPAPNTALAFMLVGIIFLTLDQGRDLPSSRRLIAFARAGLVVVAVLGMLGHVLHLEWLYRWANISRMGLTTAVGLCILSMAVTAWTYSADSDDEASRISMLATLLLIAVGVVAGLTGFAIVKHGMESLLMGNLEMVAGKRSEALLHSLRQANLLSRTLARNPALVAAMQNVNNRRGGVEPMREVARSFLPLRLTSIQFFDRNGTPVATIGDVVEFEELAVPIQVEGEDIKSSLVWGSDFVVRNVIPMRAGKEVIGSVVTEQSLPEMEQVFRYTESMGESGEVKLCGRRDDQLECFPSRLVPRVHRFPFYREGRPSYPVAQAILGETGNARVLDFRGVPVFAAYTPVGSTGLGLVAKMDSNEIYAPVRQHVGWILGLPLTVLLLAIYLIRKHLTPLATRLQMSERAARDYIDEVTRALLQLELARTQLAQSEERARTIVESAYDAYIAMDREGRVTAWNPAATTLFGWLQDEAMGRPVAELIVPERYREAHIAGMQRFLETGEGPVLGRRIELPGLHKSGVEVPVELSIRAMGGHEDRWFSCFLHDISERRRAAGELARREKLLRSLTDSIPVWVTFSDREQRIRYANQPFLEGVGIPADHVIGHTLREVLGEHIYALISPRIDLALLGQPVVFERPASESEPGRLLEVRYIPTQDAGGATAGFYAVMIDVTERHEKEARLLAQASQDGLTGLANRGACMHALAAMLKRSCETKLDMAVIFLDIDHFKQVNDTHGHATGDAVLIAAANAIRGAVRDTDLVCRLGGDEFVVLLGDTKSEAAARRVAEAIVAGGRRPVATPAGELVATLSVGVAYFHAPQCDAGTALALADASLYEAKRGGRDRYVLQRAIDASS